MPIVQLEKLPEGAVAIPLAKKAPEIGDRVHVLGNSTFFPTAGDFHQTGGAFGYSTGYVRNVYHSDDETLDTPPAAVLGPITQIFLAIAHHAPSNPGDSGGPVVNDAGELVGIHSHSASAAVFRCGRKASTSTNSGVPWRPFNFPRRTSSP